MIYCFQLFSEEIAFGFIEILVFVTLAIRIKKIPVSLLTVPFLMFLAAGVRICAILMFFNMEDPDVVKQPGPKMRFYILLNDFSNFLLNLSRWFFGYQYF